jgi:hypothetical protein
MKFIINLCRATLLLCVIAFGIKALRQPDVWWMLRTGEWIMTHSQVVRSDSFSFTFAGTPWINVKWLFEIILYGFERIGGPEFTPVFQCIIYLITFIFLEKRSRNLLRNKLAINWLLISFFFVATLTLIGVEFRMLGRPEMNSHLLTVVFLFIYERYKSKPSNLIWWLIPLQIVWTNIHEAYGVGLVILITMTGGAIIDHLFFKLKLDNRLIIAGVLAVIAISINPRGPGMILHPFEIFGQVGQNKYTVELVGFKNPLFWRKEAYFLIAFFLLSIMGWWYKSAELGHSIKNRIQSTGIGWLGLYFLFFYLGFTAYRNIPFFILYSSPLAVWFVFILIQKSKSIEKQERIISGVLFIAMLLFYSCIVSNKYYKFSNRKDTYGLYIDHNKNPSDLAKFMSKLKLKGNGFSDYLTSSYLMWNLRPGFKSYIDLRDLDVFTKEFFDNYLALSDGGELFETQSNKYNFTYAVVYLHQFDGIHFYLDRIKGWEMVYADPVAALYLKRNEFNNPIIDSLFSIQAGTVFNHPTPIISSDISQTINFTFNPFYNNDNSDSKIDYDYIGASFFSRIKDYNAALYQCKLSIKNKGDQDYNLALLGKINMDVAQVAVDKQQAVNLMQEALISYTKLVSLYPNSPEGHKGLGAYYMYAGEFTKALSFLELSVEIEPNQNVYQLIEDCKRNL